MIHMNMEPLGMLSRKPKDFVQVSGVTQLFYGSHSFTPLLNTTGDVIITFTSDFVTLKQLPFPKGFLLYFSSELFDKHSNPNRILINREN
jgi:hypothetical protein